MFDALSYEDQLEMLKSAANLAKHGIDFETAHGLRLDPDLLEIKAKTVDEQRSMVIGKIEGKHWSAIVTYRNASTRLISVRRSRDKEIEMHTYNILL